MKKYIIFFTFLPFFLFSQQTWNVEVGMYYYAPSSLVIDQGDMVIWTNAGGCHDVNGAINSITGEPFNNPETFDSEVICDSGVEIFTYVFNTPGEYNYDCSYYGHASAGMVATITVNETDCLDNNLAVEEDFGNFFITECDGLINYLIMNYGYSQQQACDWDGAPMVDLEGMLVSDICECSCQNISIEELDITRTPLLIINVSGQILNNPVFNQPMFFVYDDGSVQKIVLTK